LLLSNICCKNNFTVPLTVYANDPINQNNPQFTLRLITQITMSYGQGQKQGNDGSFSNPNDQWRDMYGQSSPYSGGASSAPSKPRRAARDALISDDEDDDDGFGAPQIRRRPPDVVKSNVKNDGHGQPPEIEKAYASARNYASEITGGPSFMTFSSPDQPSDYAFARRYDEQNNLKLPSYARDNLARSQTEVYGMSASSLQRSTSDISNPHASMRNSSQRLNIAESFDSSSSLFQTKMPGYSAESGIAGLSNPYPTLSTAREDGIMMDRSASSRRSNMNIMKPIPKEGRSMPPPSTTVDAVACKPRYSRRWNTGNVRRRQPDVMKGVNTVKTRDKSAIPPEEHVVGCLHCRKFCRVKKDALLVTCAACNKVSPASQSNKSSQ
jgi:hypothetical protein